MFKYREIVAKIWEKIDSPDIIILNGARQVGKSSILVHIQEKLKTERHIQSEYIHTFDLERSRDLALWSNQDAILRVLPLSWPNRQFVFVDEFQLSKSIGSIFKVIHDHYPQIKVFATGSASWYLSIDESLAGRKSLFTIYSLSFSEYLQWQADQKLANLFHTFQTAGSIPGQIVAAINLAFIDYLAYGGYPAVVLSPTRQDKIDRLAELIDSYFMRDIQLSAYTVNTLQLRTLLALIASRVGQLVDLPNLCKSSALGRTALMNRLELMQKTFITHTLRPFFTNKQKELVKNPKLYLLDTGLRASLLNQYDPIAQTPDFGLLAENAIVMDALKRKPVDLAYAFWRTKTGQEVDLVRQIGSAITPIEIKTGSTDRIPENLKSFIKLYRPKEAYLLNWDMVFDIAYEQCVVHFRPLWWQF